MIEVFNKKMELVGFIDGKKYLNKKKKLIGFLENNKFKDKTGYILLILQDNGLITWNEGELQGYIKEGKIYSSLDDRVLFEFKKEDEKILNSNGETILYLKGNVESLEFEDFFGIVGQFLELFA